MVLMFMEVFVEDDVLNIVVSVVDYGGEYG